jgi:ribonuclease-3
VKLSADLQAFQDRLGHQFAEPELLLRALTHPSMSSPARPSNQRLEFLGDRILNLVIAEAVYRGDSEAAEGQLAPRYNALVRKEACAEVAREIELGEVMRLGRSETMSGGRRKLAMLADGIEAVVAAIYLDAGLEASRAIVLRLWEPQLTGTEGGVQDPKTAVQEWAQARGLPPPTYVEVARDGPDHAPIFTIEARLSDGTLEAAQAGSKRQAEQRAAEALLEKLPK